MYSFSTKGIRSKRIIIKVNGLRVPLLIMRPLFESSNAPGILWIHGGGYMTGMKEMAYIGRAVDLVRNHGAVVIAPGYHLSLFHPYPTALKDCYGALLYIKKHAEELGINPSQIMVGGESAGGGLAAGIDAEVDVYDGMYHAFDMSEPKSAAGSEAIKKFNEHFAYAKAHYFADQNGNG